MLMTDVDIDDNDDIDVQGGCSLQDANVKILIFLEIELVNNTLLILLGCI